MSYVEVLIAVVVFAIIVTPLTLSMNENIVTAADNVKIERAINIAKKDADNYISGRPSEVVVGYTITRDESKRETEYYTKITVSWDVIKQSKSYSIYVTVPKLEYGDFN